MNQLTAITDYCFTVTKNYIMFTKTDIEKYFLAEKQSGFVFLVIGIIAIVVAIVFYFVLKTNFYKGAAIPLLLIGLFECFVGNSVRKRSDDDRIKNVYAYDMNPDQLKNEELPRVKEMSKGITIYMGVELAIGVAGVVLMFLYKGQKVNSFWYGIGVALVIQGLITLGAEYFAGKRIQEYTQGLEKHLSKK